MPVQATSAGSPSPIDDAAAGLAAASGSLSLLADKAMAFAPRLILALLALLAGFFAARFAAGLTRRLAARINLGGLLQRAGIAGFLARAQPGMGVEDLLAAIIRRLVQLGALLFALDALGIHAAMDLLGTLFGYLPRLVTALVALVAGAWLAQLASSLTMAAAAGAGLDFHRQLGGTVRGLILVITTILALDQLGVRTELLQGTFLNLLSIAAAGIALAFGLGSRDILADLLAGYYARQRFYPGETLAVGEREGVLTMVGPLNSELEAPGDGGRIVVPNRTLLGTTVLIKD